MNEQIVIADAICTYLGMNVKWTEFGNILVDIGRFVSAEKATQIYNKSSKSPKSEVPLDQQVYFGRKRVISKAIGELLSRHKIEKSLITPDGKGIENTQYLLANELVYNISSSKTILSNLKKRFHSLTLPESELKLMDSMIFCMDNLLTNWETNYARSNSSK